MLFDILLMIFLCYEEKLVLVDKGCFEIINFVRVVFIDSGVEF